MNVQDIDKALGKNAELVNIEATNTSFIIRQKDYIPKPVWMEVHAVMIRFGGKWVKMDKAGHWKIPFKQDKPTRLTIKGHIAIIEGELEWLKKWLTEEMK